MKEQRNLALSAMFIATGLVLPFLTGQVPQFGRMLLPMHIPVFLCALICGWKHGATVGFILPPLRYVLFGMPMLYPTGTAMMFELATYAVVAGILYNRRQSVAALYTAMLAAMVCGRVVWGIAQMMLLGLGGFTWSMFIAGAFVEAVPGIVVQLTIIPAVMVTLQRAGLLKAQ